MPSSTDVVKLARAAAAWPSYAAPAGLARLSMVRVRAHPDDFDRFALSVDRAV